MEQEANMSFDEQPDGDPHGECAAEIHQLQEQLEAANKKGHEAVLLAMEREDTARRKQGSIDTLERECNQLNDMTISQRLLIEELASMCRRLGYSVKRSGNDKLAHQCVELLKKHDLGGSVIREQLGTAHIPLYKYPETFCSQCGGEFGPGNEGFSHCENHKHLPRIG